MPFRAPECHSRSRIQRADEQKEGNADGRHDDTEPFELVFGGHICHAEDGGDEC